MGTYPPLQKDMSLLTINIPPVTLVMSLSPQVTHSAYSAGGTRDGRMQIVRAFPAAGASSASIWHKMDDKHTGSNNAFWNEEHRLSSFVLYTLSIKQVHNVEGIHCRTLPGQRVSKETGWIMWPWRVACGVWQLRCITPPPPKKKVLPAHCKHLLRM